MLTEYIISNIIKNIRILVVELENSANIINEHITAAKQISEQKQKQE